jgi:hypothetical protein
MARASLASDWDRARDGRSNSRSGVDLERNSGAGVLPRRELARGRSPTQGDRLRAMEQLESRALGKPKKTVEQVNEEPEELAAMRAMSPEARRILLRQMNEAERQARSGSEH